MKRLFLILAVVLKLVLDGTHALHLPQDSLQLHLERSALSRNGVDFGVLKKAFSIYHDQAQLWVGKSRRLILPNTRVYEGEHSSLSILRNGSVQGVYVHDKTAYEFTAQGEVQHQGDSHEFLLKPGTDETRKLSGTAVGGCKTKDVEPLPRDRRLSSVTDVVGGHRGLEDISRWMGCYREEETTRYLDIGVVADCSFYQQHGYSLEVVLHTIESFVSRTNLIFSKQLNIRLRVKQILVLPCDGPDSTLPFNLCRNSIENDLASFAAWVGSLKFGADQQEQIVQVGVF